MNGLAVQLRLAALQGEPKLGLDRQRALAAARAVAAGQGARRAPDFWSVAGLVELRYAGRRWPQGRLAAASAGIEQGFADLAPACAGQAPVGLGARPGASSCCSRHADSVAGRGEAAQALLKQLEGAGRTPIRMTPHAFVAMPFGTKPGADGTPIDFNRIYAELLDAGAAGRRLRGLPRRRRAARRRHPHRHVPGAAGRRPGARRPDARQPQRLVRARRAPRAARARRAAGAGAAADAALRHLHRPQAALPPEGRRARPGLRRTPTAPR